MKVERISGVVQTRGPQGHTEPRPAPGQSLLLTYAEEAGAEHIATLSNGMTLRLTGLGRWQRELRPGDALRVRVLSNDPVLELEVESGPIRSGTRGAIDEDGPAAMSRHAAMRIDQAALRRMTWLAPNPAALAKSWHDLALERWGARVVLGRGSHEAYTTMQGPPPFREPPGTPQGTVLERWLLPVYAWGGTQMMLGLIYSKDRERKGRVARARSPLLRLELSSPTLGPLVLHVHWLAGGIDLTISVKEQRAAKVAREALPNIARTLLDASLALADLRLTHDDAVIARIDADKLRPRTIPLATQRSLLPLFRALAETAIILVQLVP